MLRFVSFERRLWTSAGAFRRNCTPRCCCSRSHFPERQTPHQAWEEAWPRPFAWYQTSCAARVRLGGGGKSDWKGGRCNPQRFDHLWTGRWFVSNSASFPRSCGDSWVKEKGARNCARSTQMHETCRMVLRESLSAKTFLMASGASGVGKALSRRRVRN